MSDNSGKYIWHNGLMVPWEDAKVHVLVHALHYGSSVFVIDMEDGGKVLKEIDVADKSGNSVVNSVPSSVIPIIADGSSLSNYYGAIAYFADYEGKLWKLNLSDKGTLYAIQQLFDAESTDANGRRVMKDIVASIDNQSQVPFHSRVTSGHTVRRGSVLFHH